MPKKKNGLFSTLLLPLTLTNRVVLYPIQLIMSFIVDELGDNLTREGQYEKEPKLIEKPWFWAKFLKTAQFSGYSAKDIISYVKEYRGVLCDYFGWKKGPSPAWKCKGCSQPGKIWCVECNKKWCPQCAYTQHYPGSSTQGHSLEPIIDRWDKAGVHLFTPVVPQLMFFGAFVYFTNKVPLITEDYLTTQVTCPIVQEVQYYAASLDTSLFYHYKQSFFSWCNMEDSFLRFFLDGWVRSVVTGTDNTLLVLQTLPQALLFDMVLMYTIAPVVSVLYAVVLNFFYQLELWIPRNIPVLKSMADLSEMCNLGTYFGVGDNSKLPPPTASRTRQAMDPLDAFNYLWGRKMRHFNYYLGECSAAIQHVSWSLIKYTLIFRIAACWFKFIGRFAKAFFKISPFLRLEMNLHDKWFQGVLFTRDKNGDLVQKMYVSEDRLWEKLAQAYNIATSIVDAYSPWPIRLWTYQWAFLWSCFVIACAYASHLIVMKRRQFNKSFNADATLEFGQKKVLAERPTHFVK